MWLTQLSSLRRVFHVHDEEIVYVNSLYVVKNHGIVTKNVMAGSSRLVSKVHHRHHHRDSDGEGSNKRYEHGPYLFYYQPNHLGSTQFITDRKGELYQHLEDFPFGETWVDEGHRPSIDYRFTGKELDVETGFVYFGARYYDPRTSIWISADPALDKYLPATNTEQASNLPGFGGVYNTMNLGVYGYGHQNPVKYIDPDGKIVWIPIIMGVIWLADKGYAAYELNEDRKAIERGEKTVEGVALDRGIEHAAGMAAGPAGRWVAKGAKQIARHGDEVADAAQAIKNAKKTCSFSPDTVVATPDGLKRISLLEAGDTVLAQNDDATGKVEPRDILDAYTHEHLDGIKLTVDDGQGVVETITTTAEHPFYIVGKGWTPAGKLKNGDILKTVTGVVKLTGATHVQHNLLTHNLTVDVGHTFYVGQAQLWVHNGCDPTKDIKTSSPALKGDPYHPDEVAKRIKPSYKPNPAHDTKSGNFNPRKTPEPKDAADVYQNAVRGGMGTWYGKGAGGKFYRYFSDNAGGVHFSGALPQSQIPKDILKQLGH